MIYIKLTILTLSLLLFTACGENTTTQISTDVNDMRIDQVSPQSVYSTDIFLPTATSYNIDGTTGDATDNVDWKVSDITQAYISTTNEVLPIVNEGNITLIAGYSSFKYFENNITLNIVGITDLNSSWRIVSPIDVNSSGDFILEAEGNFTDGTINKKIVRNIVWTSSDVDIATISVDEDYVTTLNVIGTGDLNITATLFNDLNTTITKSFTIY